MSRLIKIILVLLFLLYSYLFPQVKINEIMSSNFRQVYDENNETPDWIELYNTSVNPVNLKGYKISNIDDFEKTWILPDTIISGHSFLTLFASGENRTHSKSLIIEAEGQDFTNGDDEDSFVFDYIPVNGDFDCIINISSMRNYGSNTQAMLMLREKLTNNSRYIGVVCQNPITKGYRLLHRDSESKNPKIEYFWGTEVEFPNSIIRLVREGDTLTGYVKTEGYSWKKMIRLYYPNSSETHFLGIAFESGIENQLAKLSVKEMYLNHKNIPLDSLNRIDLNTNIIGRAYLSNELHTDFKLSRSGDKLFLWDKSGNKIDNMEFKQQLTNISYGCYPDGSSDFQFMDNPSFNSQNHSGYTGICEAPQFSIESAWSNNPISVKINNNDPYATVYYTLGGSRPDKNSLKYNNGLMNINSTTVIRAIAFRDNYLPSDIVSNTYFINDSSVIPVISLITDTANLYGKYGIFNPENRYKNIEIPVNFELFDKDKNLTFESGAGAKLNGQASSQFKQKSIRVYARSLYGNSSFDYPFFGSSGLAKYETLIFRNSGTEWNRSLLRDGFASVLTEEIPNVDAKGYQPALMFINGKFYGIQNIRERLDASYFHLKYKIPEDSVNLLSDWGVLKNGVSKDFFVFADSIQKMDMTSDFAYDYINQNIDLDNLIDFLVYQIYIANIDWPWKNHEWWSSISYDNKWRWVLTDMDYTFGIASNPQYDMFRLLTDTTYLFPRLFLKFKDNETFRNRLLNRTGDFMSTIFPPEKVLPVLDSLAGVIRPEIPRQIAKYDSSAMNWEHEISVMRDFITKRNDSLPDAFIKYFNLAGKSNVLLSVNPKNSGYIKINKIFPQGYPWKGIYFQDVPISIKAIPKKGYKFVSWSNPEFTSDSFITMLPDTFDLTVNFIKSGQPDTDVVINEIMYKCNKNFDSEDWIELANASNKDIRLDNWILKDSKDDHIFKFSPNTLLKADSFMVVCKSIDDFQNIYPDVENIIGEFDFGFGTDDVIRLYDSDNKLIDSVKYTSETPWCEEANGSGKSLELKDVNSDNNLAVNWLCSYELYGTPGRRNSRSTDTNIKASNKDILITNYPNPARTYTYFIIKSDKYYLIDVNLYNSMGQKITDKINYGNNDLNDNIIKIETSGLSNGVYYCKFLFDNRINKTVAFVVEK